MVTTLIGPRVAGSYKTRTIGAWKVGGLCQMNRLHDEHELAGDDGDPLAAAVARHPGQLHWCPCWVGWIGDQHWAYCTLCGWPRVPLNREAEERQS